MFRIALRTVVAHRLRLVLTALAAVLGVAFVVGTLTFTAALDRSFTDLFTGTAQDVLVEPAEGQGIPDSVVGEISVVPGVAAVAGTAEGFGIILLDSAGEPVGGDGPPAFGITWLDEPLLSRTPLVEGRGPVDPGEIAVDDSTFDRLGLPLGSEVELAVPDGRATAELVGVFQVGGTEAFGGVTYTALVPEQAQEYFTEPGTWSAVSVAVSGRTDTEVAGELRALLGPGYEVQTRDQQIDTATRQLREGLGFVTTIISVFAGIALFVAGFLIFNTFSMLIAQRGRELALLRAVGALRRQILLSVLVEALIVAAVAAALGVVGGYLLAAGLKALLGALGLTITAPLGITLQAVVWAVMLSGTVITVSALVPAWRAARTPPVAALRDNDAPADSVGWVRTILGVIVLAVGAWRIWLALAGGLDATGTGVAVALLLAAGILLAPALAKLFAAAFSRVFGLVAGVSGRIAARNTGRAPGRVAATAAALMIGLALVTGVSVIVSSVQASIVGLIDRSFIGDVVVTAGGRGFSPVIAEAVGEVPGVAVAVQLSAGPVELDGRQINAVAAGVQGDPAFFQSLLGTADPADLVGDRALISEEFAMAQGLAVGDPLDLVVVDGGPLPLTVGAVIADEPLLGDLAVPLPQFRAAGGDPDDQSVYVAFDDSRPRAETLVDVERAVAINPVLDVLSADQLKDRVEGQLNQLLYLVFGLLGLSIVIAALGVVNTMALSVVERTREIGLLRAVGASRRQVRRMVRWEAVLVAMLGGALGLAVGVLAGAGLQRSLADDGIDVLAIPWGTLVIVFAAAIIIGLVGALLPAWRASRWDILRAIGAE